MATLAISPIPLRFNDMASRRIPLGEVPNAANSPARHLTSHKRPRDQLEVSEKSNFDIQPRLKRPALDTNHLRLRVSPSAKPRVTREDRAVTRPTASHPTQFERRLLAAKENGASQRVQRTEKSFEELAGIRRWQQHYKKAFPAFVFYFESIPEDVRARYSKIVRNLGAKEEKFFSKSVTHLITNRSIPSQTEGKQHIEAAPTNHERSTSFATQSKTIDPALLEKSNEPPNVTVSKGKFDFDAHMRRAHSGLVRDVEQTKPQSSSVDVLLKAQDLGVKIWQLNKLERILNTIFGVPDDSQGITNADAGKKASQVVDKQQRDADLSRMLRHERLHGPSDRATSTNVHEIVQFRGPYVLVRDMDERTKPIMMKEWPKPAKKGDSGEWPQFRAVSYGKCPFVEEVNREDLEREMARQEQVDAQHRQSKSREGSRSRQASRAITPIEIFEDEEDEEDAPQDVADAILEEHKQLNHRPSEAKRPDAKESKMVKPKIPDPTPCPPPNTLPPQTRSPIKPQGRDGLQASKKPSGVEPAASGVQPSNITSAIRSQIISSTASAPFSKAGTLREIHGLKRKVLEKNAGPALNAMQGKASNDLSNGRAEAHISRSRRDKLQARELLTQIGEESTNTEDDEDIWLAEDVRTAENVSKKDPQARRKEPKPGYCENCREKYEDFDDHIVGRRHRRFALNSDNWKDLDRFLAKVARPLKSPVLESLDDGF